MLSCCSTSVNNNPLEMAAVSVLVCVACITSQKSTFFFSPPFLVSQQWAESSWYMRCKVKLHSLTGKCHLNGRTAGVFALTDLWLWSVGLVRCHSGRINRVYMSSTQTFEQLYIITGSDGSQCFAGFCQVGLVNGQVSSPVNVAECYRLDSKTSRPTGVIVVM